MSNVDLLIGRRDRTTRRNILKIGGSLVAASVTGACALTPSSAASQSGQHIKSVTAITEVFGDGQKLTAVAVEYDKAIATAKLSLSDFSVSGRTITNVYANTAPAKASQGVNGSYVIIELSPNDANASTIVQGANPPASAAAQPTGTPAANAQGAGSQGGPPQGMPNNKIEVKASVTQVGDIITTDGETYASSSNAITNNKVINLVADDFSQHAYKDPQTGVTVKYNLFVPKNYDKNTSYPLVMFIHDAGVLSNDTKMTLAQGLGGVVWASPSEQAKHACFVLAPQYSTTIANDNSETTPDADATVNLIKSLESQYNIDTNRIYTTGQSMGGMTSIALLIKYPDLFAAALLVACQWDARKMSVLNKAKMWAIVSEGDVKAFPGWNAILPILQAEGAKISRATWEGRATGTEQEADVSNAQEFESVRMIAEGNNIKYTVLKKGTVVPTGQTDDPGNNHMNTWKIAYTIQGLRDWLFTQTKA